MKNNKIVGVTGDNGFIGSHLVDELKIPYQGFDRKKHNLLDIDSMKDFVENKKIIFHFAALNRGTDSDVLNINFIGTLNLLEAIKKYNPDATLVFVSTFQLYKRTEKKTKLNETSALEPKNFCSYSKKIAEEAILQSNIKSIILRVTNVYGPGCKPYYNSVISTFIDLALNNKPLVLKGNTESGFDFIYVKDVVSALIKCIDMKIKKTTILNLCTGKAYTINQLIHFIEKALNKTLKKNIEPTEEKATYSLGDNSKIKKMLSFEPKWDLEEGLNDMIKHIKNEN